ncbi:MAG: hypothetical protein ABIR52_07620 [Casimicrobiaceae bacterium]
MKKLVAFAAPFVLAGCQSWGPTWSELTGVRYNDLTSLTDGAVVVNLVDGFSPGTAPRETIKVTPGMHKLVLQAIPPGSRAGQIDVEATEVDFKPCTRYYVNARFTASTSASWRPFIDREETIPGCKAPAKS